MPRSTALNPLICTFSLFSFSLSKRYSNCKALLCRLGILLLPSLESWMNLDCHLRRFVYTHCLMLTVNCNVLFFFYFHFFLSHIVSHFSFLQYSVFGSILTIGAMISAITSGRIADSIGRKGVSREEIIHGNI